LFHQPTLHGVNEHSYFYKKKLFFSGIKVKQIKFYKQYSLNLELNLFYQFFYFFFLMCALYTNTFLPYGRFYNRLGGNIGMLGAYFFVFFYLSAIFLRRPVFIGLYFYFIFNKINFLKKCFI